MTEHPFSLEGRAVLVSGAGRGIGYECAKMIAAAGATVALTARTPEQVEAAAGSIRAIGGRAHGFAFDVAEIEQHDALIDRVEAACGPLLGLVNVAGISPTFDRAETLTPADFDAIMRVNQRGTFFLTQAVAKRMLARESGGSIVTLASIAGSHGAPRLAAYSMSRAAVVAMTKTMAAEWAYAPANPIRVNCVAPGWVASAFTSQLPAWYIERCEQHTAMRRFARPEEIAGAALYLLSDAASFVTGAVMAIDGGYGMWSPDPAPKRA